MVIQVICLLTVLSAHTLMSLAVVLFVVGWAAIGCGVWYQGWYRWRKGKRKGAR